MTVGILSHVYDDVHQMETFSALLAMCAWNSPVTGEFPSQRPVTRSFDVFFDLRLNKRLSHQSWGWWSETPWRPLWHHRNVNATGWHVPLAKTHRSTPLFPGWIVQWHWGYCLPVWYHLSVLVTHLKAGDPRHCQGVSTKPTSWCMQGQSTSSTLRTTMVPREWTPRSRWDCYEV